MTCWMKFLGLVQDLTGVSEPEAVDILKDVERDVGHEENLIKAVIDMEQATLVKRLKKRKKSEDEHAVAYN